MSIRGSVPLIDEELPIGIVPVELRGAGVDAAAATVVEWAADALQRAAGQDLTLVLHLDCLHLRRAVFSFHSFFIVL